MKAFLNLEILLFSMIKKLIALPLIIVLVVNIVLFVMGMINALFFWAVIILVGLIAYKVLPKVKNGKNN